MVIVRLSPGFVTVPPCCGCLPLAAGLCAVTAAAVHFQFRLVDITLCISQIRDFLFDEHERENELNAFVFFPTL